ncbi:MAG: hypothetical protein VB104_04840 [Candidatus Limiplasma sp.]|nr:hypothetical protein [Candidatus Limiplasma sp.]
MLYQVIMRLIDRGAVAGLRGKVDVLYAVGRLTDDEYQMLIAQL